MPKGAFYVFPEHQGHREDFRFMEDYLLNGPASPALRYGLRS